MVSNITFFKFLKRQFFMNKKLYINVFISASKYSNYLKHLTEVHRKPDALKNNNLKRKLKQKG